MSMYVGTVLFCHKAVSSYPAFHRQRGFAHPAWLPAALCVSAVGCSPPSPVWAAGGTILENSVLPVLQRKHTAKIKPSFTVCAWNYTLALFKSQKTTCENLSVTLHLWHLLLHRVNFNIQLHDLTNTKYYIHDQDMLTCRHVVNVHFYSVIQ